MTTTVSLANLPTNPNDVAVHLFAAGVFGLRKAESNADQTSYLSEFVLKASDPHYPTTVRITATLDQGGVWRNSLRLRTYKTVVIDSVLAGITPDDVVITWSNSGQAEDLAAKIKMIGCAYGLTFDSIVSKVPQTGVLAAVSNGLLSDAIG